MPKEITRRTFIKQGFTGTAAFSICGLGIGLGDSLKLEKTVTCKKCGGVNLFSRSFLSSLISLMEPQYCRNCGININSLLFDIECKDLHICSMEMTTGKSGPKTLACCQIPFPNNVYLKNANKPDFLLSNLKF